MHSLCWVEKLNTTCRWGVTTADWKIEPQKTHGKTANRAARVFIADFYSGNIARVHSSVRFHFSEIQSYYSLFLQISTFTSHFHAHKRMHARAIFVRGLFAVSRIYSRFVRAIARFQHKFSVNHAKSAYFQRKFSANLGKSAQSAPLV